MTIFASVICIWAFVTVELSFVALYRYVFTHKNFERSNKMAGILLVTHGIEESSAVFDSCIEMPSDIQKPAAPGYCVNLTAYCYASVSDSILLLGESGY